MSTELTNSMSILALIVFSDTYTPLHRPHKVEISSLIVLETITSLHAPLTYHLLTPLPTPPKEGGTGWGKLQRLGCFT